MCRLDTISITAESNSRSKELSPPVERIVVVVKVSAMWPADPEVALDLSDRSSKARSTKDLLATLFTTLKEREILSVTAPNALKQPDSFLLLL
jgi:hypothetical protein